MPEGTEKDDFKHMICAKIGITDDLYIDERLLSLIDNAYSDTRLIRLNGYKLSDYEDYNDGVVN